MMIEGIIKLIAPHTCIGCGSEGTLLCAWCAPDAIQPVPERCYRCRAVSQDSQTCKDCRRKTVLQHVWVCSVYEGAARKLVYGLKFERTKAAADKIAAILDEALPYLPPTVVVTYIPTAQKRIRLRGYDQTQLIAKKIAKLRGLPCRSLLIRHGHARQVGASKTARAEQAAQNYSAKYPKIQHQSVLLIDDILTTGATTEAASKILKKAGVKHINAAVFAQK